MKKLAISLAVVAGLAGLACAAVPWYVGMETEKYFQTQVNESVLGPDASMTLKMVQYDRGWLRATAVQRLALKADPSVQFDIRHEINHIPDPHVGWVTVRSTPVWPKEVQAAADYYFGNQPALATRVTSPAFSKPMLKSPETKVTWGGASGTLAFGEGGMVQVKLQAPSVGATFPGGSMVVSNSALEGRWVIKGPGTDWHGDTSLSFGKIEVGGPLGKASVSGMRVAFSQRDQGETVQVGYSVNIGKGEASGAGQSVTAFSNAVFDVELDKLDKKAIAKYVQDTNNAQAAKIGDPARERLALQLTIGFLTDVLKGSPVLRVKKLGVETPAGAIAGSATVSFDGKELGQPTMPMEWLQRVTFNGSAEVSRALLKSMMQPKMQAQATMMLSQNGTPADPAQLQQLVDKALEDQFKAWAGAGLVQDKGDKLVVQADFSKGKLLLNGQPGDHLMPPMLLAPQPQPAVLKAPGDEA
jgi:uncharacterized protein YdgA (DUF945 family)